MQTEIDKEPGTGLTAVAGLAGVLTIEAAIQSAFLARREDGREIELQRAVSCLVEPVPGDRVLTVEVGEQTYVLAVLERPSEAPLKIDTPGELVVSAKRVSIRTGVFDLVAEAANLVGHAFNSLFRTSKRISGTDTVIAQSTSLSAKERVSIISGADVQQAGVLSQSVEGPVAQTSHTAVVTAKTDIRLNAERINVG